MNSANRLSLVLACISIVCIQCNSRSDIMEQNAIAPLLDQKLTSEITCPQCGHQKVETLPTEVCQIRYTCENCKAELMPQGEDCCVFCSYGDHKCPSKQ
ncbi:MAG: GDCCVxC domain-containing (seleno)protein [Flavobacteriales bacterium]